MQIPDDIFAILNNHITPATEEEILRLRAMMKDGSAKGRELRLAILPTPLFSAWLHFNKDNINLMNMSARIRAGENV